MPIRLDIELVKSFGDTLLSDMKTSLDVNGSTASGATKDSLRTEITPNRFKLFGRGFIGALETGRKRTSADGDGGLYKKIRQWIDDKGIIAQGISRDSLAYVITRKIHQEGDLLHRTGSNYQGKASPTGIILGVINDGRIKELSKGLLFEAVQTVKKELSNANSSN